MATPDRYAHLRHPANQPRPPFGPWEELCATCDRPFPYLNKDTAANMLHVGWTRRGDGAWICDPCAKAKP